MSTARWTLLRVFRNGPVSEELARQDDHAVDEIGLDDVVPDLALSRDWLDDIEPLRLNP
jgi:hypothetical protein